MLPVPPAPPIVPPLLIPALVPPAAPPLAPPALCARATPENVRLIAAAPSPLSAGFKVAKAMSCKGMNTRPMPAPWTTITVMIQPLETSGVHSIIQ